MNQEKEIFDKQHISKPIIFFKGIGRYCEVCNNHVFGRKDKTTCSNKCRKIKYRMKTIKNYNNSIQARISIEKTDDFKPYRIISLYLKKGIIHQIRITEKTEELWSLLEKIEDFRSKEIIIHA